MNNIRNRDSDRVLHYVDHPDSIGVGFARFVYLSYLPEPRIFGLELPSRDGSEPCPLDVYITRKIVR